MLVKQVEKREFNVEIQYRRVVKPDGNARAREFIDEVFKPSDTSWRGFGAIPSSGLVLRDEFADFDAEKRFPVEIEDIADPKGCLCGDVLRGHIEPSECPLFANACIPENPIGPCMVSTEGTCAAFFRYSRKT